MIGLIFGETDFPKYIYKKIKGKKNYLIIDLTKKKFFKKDKNSYSLSVGQFGKIISILKKNKCKKILFAGRVQKPNFSKIKFDFKGVYYIPRIIKKAKLGDAALLKEIIKIFKKEKIQTISSTSLTPELCLKKGNYSKYRPSKKDKIDIRNGLISLNSSNQLSHVQGAISINNTIILETRDGTQKMLKKVKKINNINNGVLIKYPKKKQDLRIDLPTIGLSTLKQCKISGLKGVVLKHKKNIFLDKEKSIKLANKNKMFILVK
tara:strand:- start:1406 stop:2194 length:789 start_codon:yes stop_codon:yes gene_type:complete